MSLFAAKATAILVLASVVCLEVDRAIHIARWASKAGLETVTTPRLRDSTQILDYKVEAYYSLADAPNHWWLIRDSNGLVYLANPASEPLQDWFSQKEEFSDIWSKIHKDYRAERIGRVIKGVGTGNEYLILSSDGDTAILYAFRT